MTTQTQQLIEAGYVTRKQAALILGKGDGSNITEMCHRGGVKFIEIPRGDKRVTTLFWGEGVVRLFAKMDKKNRIYLDKFGDRPKQAQLPVVKTETIGFYHTPPSLPDAIPERMLLIPEAEIMDALGRIEAMLTALLGRKES